MTNTNQVLDRSNASAMHSLPLHPHTCLQVESLDEVYTHQVAAGTGFTLFLVDSDAPQVCVHSLHAQQVSDFIVCSLQLTAYIIMMACAKQHHARQPVVCCPSSLPQIQNLPEWQSEAPETSSSGADEEGGEGAGGQGCWLCRRAWLRL
jgi:hypothetical protein